MGSQIEISSALPALSGKGIIAVMARCAEFARSIFPILLKIVKIIKWKFFYRNHLVYMSYYHTVNIELK